MDEMSSRNYPVNEHFGFQRRTWAVERIGWIVLALITLIALSGALGSGGPLTSAQVRNDALTVDYNRFQRRTVVTRFVFRFSGPAGEHNLHLDDAFQRDYEVSSIQPVPTQSRASASGYDLTFAADGAASAVVTIWAKPHIMGAVRISARAGHAQPLAIPVFVYP